MQEVKVNTLQAIGHFITRFIVSDRLESTSYSPLMVRHSSNLKVKALEDKFSRICIELEQLAKLETKLRDYLSQAGYIDPKLLVKHKRIRENIIIVKYRLIKLEERKEDLNEELKAIIDELDNIPNHESKAEVVSTWALNIEKFLAKTLVSCSVGVVCIFNNHYTTKLNRGFIGRSKLTNMIIYFKPQLDNLFRKQAFKVLDNHTSRPKFNLRIREPDD